MSQCVVWQETFWYIACKCCTFWCWIKKIKPLWHFFGVGKNVQYWRLVSTRKAHLSVRTSRTNRLMYSRVVVDPCIFITRSLSYMTLPVHRKVPVAVDSYESYGSSNVFTSRCRPWISLLTLQMHKEEWVSRVLLRTTREMRTGEWIFLVLLRTMRGMCRCQISHFTELIHGSTTTREFIRRFVRLVRMDKWALQVVSIGQLSGWGGGGGGGGVGDTWTEFFKQHFDRIGAICRIMNLP